MSAIPYEDENTTWDGLDDESMLLPPRRRRIWGKSSAVLLAVAVGAICFYIGVRVEKGQLSNSSSGFSPSALASRFGAAGGTSGAAGTFSRLSSRAPSGIGGGAFPGGAGGSFGTVASVDGKTIYVNESGNTVKVKLSGSTKITKSVGVGRSAIHPGDSVVVSGVSGSGGTVTATSVSDSGSSGSSPSGSSSGGSSSGGSGSGVSSLFQSGGG